MTYVACEAIHLAGFMAAFSYGAWPRAALHASLAFALLLWLDKDLSCP